MSSKITVGVVFSSQFRTGTSRKFTSYIDYMDRKNAIRNVHFDKYNMVEFDGYNHYMGNPEKSSGLFSLQKNKLSKNEILDIKKQFIEAQKNDSIMWQDVVSFDNKWLEKYGLYDTEKGILNEAVVMQSIREAVQDIIRKEGMSNSAIWTGAIHYNTKHIHVHIAIVEPKPTRPYKTFENKKTGQTYEARVGYRKETNIKNFRSKIVSRILNREAELTKISSLIRESIAIRDMNFRALPDRQLRKQYLKIMNHLPDDKRLWKYNMNALKELRPLIDQFSKFFIEKYHHEEMKELVSAIEKQEIINKEVYGIGNKNFERYQDTTSNKIDELYARMGNILLRDMKVYHSEMMKEQFIKEHQSSFSNAPIKSSKPNLNRMKKALSNEFDRSKNQRKYRQLQNEIEQENERS